MYGHMYLHKYITTTKSVFLVCLYVCVYGFRAGQPVRELIPGKDLCLLLPAVTNCL